MKNIKPVCFAPGTVVEFLEDFAYWSQGDQAIVSRVFFDEDGLPFKDQPRSLDVVYQLLWNGSVKELLVPHEKLALVSLPTMVSLLMIFDDDPEAHVFNENFEVGGEGEGDDDEEGDEDEGFGEDDVSPVDWPSK